MFNKECLARQNRIVVRAMQCTKFKKFECVALMTRIDPVSFQVPFGRPAMDVGVGGGGIAVAGGVPAVGGGGGASAAVAAVNAALQQVHMQPQPPQPKAAGNTGFFCGRMSGGYRWSSPPVP